MDTAETTEHVWKQVGITDWVVVIVGVAIFATWLVRTSLGTRALAGSRARRNNMPVYYPLVLAVLWVLLVWGAFSAKRQWLGGLSQQASAIADNLILCIGSLVPGAVILAAAQRHFARGLKGFGLSARTVGRDLWAAFVNLLGILPIVGAMIILVMTAGQTVVGPGYEMPQHGELQQAAERPEAVVRVVILITAIFVVPVFEELLFRGMFQTAIRSFLESRRGQLQSGNAAWPAVLLSAFIFATFHQHPEHWPALFALAVCLGYAYEKSGSLLRPIFIHSLFNATAVLSTLAQ